MSLEPLRRSNVGRFPYVQKMGWPLLESTGEALVTRHCNQKQSQPCKCGATLLVNMRDIEPRKEDDGFDGAFLSP